MTVTSMRPRCWRHLVAPMIPRLPKQRFNMPSIQVPVPRCAELELLLPERFEKGQQRLLAFLQDGRFSEDLHVALASVLLSSESATIRMESAELLSLPKTASREPLPPLSELAKMTGDVVRGADVFRKEGTCSNCHRIRDEGKQIGPDLSEIGSKLAPEAMYVTDPRSQCRDQL